MFQRVRGASSDCHRRFPLEHSQATQVARHSQGFIALPVCLQARCATSHPLSVPPSGGKSDSVPTCTQRGQAADCERSKSRPRQGRRTPVLRRPADVLQRRGMKGLPDDAQLDQKYLDLRDEAIRRALHLDASEHRPVVSLPADVPGFVQEDLAVSHVGRRGRNAAIAGVGRRNNFSGESVLLLNVGASALPAGCRIRLRYRTRLGHCRRGGNPRFPRRTGSRRYAAS